MKSPPSLREGVLVGLALLLALAAGSRGAATTYDNYAWLADAWLHGHVWIHFPGPEVDAIPFHGRAYVIEGPMPAVVMLPFVAIWGTGANQTTAAMLVGCVGAGAAWIFARRIGLGIGRAAVVTSFLVFGTSYFVCAAVGSVWFFAHVAGVAFTFLAFAELAGPRRAWLALLWAFAAGFSRSPMLAVVPLVAISVLATDRRRATIVQVAGVAVACTAAWVAYNEVRFQSPFDIGFSLFWKIMDPRSAGGAPMLSVAYLPEQVRALFVSAPAFAATPPWIVPGYFGTALTWTSAGLTTAFFAPWRIRAVPLLWLATIVTAVPVLLYYGTGDWQYGVRHALDFEPYLIALMAIALRERASPWLMALPTFNVAFGLFEGFVWLWDSGVTPH